MSAFDPNRTSKTRRFWIACKPETPLFSTETWFDGALVRVDCKRELTCESEAIFDWETVANAGMYDHILSLVSPSGLASGPTQMPKFLRIGVHQSNVSGYTSKAWWVRRVGSTVFLKWGAVEVHGVADGRKIYWTLPPRAKTIRCGTMQRAKDYAKTAIARRRSHRYEPLAGNIAIRRRRANRGAELEQALATILFVDIVRSTEKAARLGDSRWTQVMNHYYAAARRELKSLRGKEVVTTGDGLLATFDAPASGIRCATAIREAVRTLGLEIRMGLHAGEYKVNGTDVVGLAFHVGARVAAKARAGEVLVSSAVKDLMSQSGIRFKDRGVHRLKGVPKRWRLYRVEQ
jgi:class 3 adenylate cyclase